VFDVESPPASNGKADDSVAFKNLATSDVGVDLDRAPDRQADRPADAGVDETPDRQAQGPADHPLTPALTAILAQACLRTTMAVSQGVRAPVPNVADGVAPALTT
jgi:hypothetical protein